MAKNPPANSRDPGLIPGLGRCLEEEMEPTPVSLPEKFHGQRSLVGYSPWGRKTSHITEGTEHASNK